MRFFRLETPSIFSIWFLLKSKNSKKVWFDKSFNFSIRLLEKLAEVIRDPKALCPVDHFTSELHNGVQKLRQSRNELSLEKGQKNN